MQVIVREGEDFVFAQHDDGQDVASLYPETTTQGPSGAPVTIPAGIVVAVPHGFHFAVDDLGRLRDPRRWAGEGSTPLGP
jgi:hypothetical protein